MEWNKDCTTIFQGVLNSFYKKSFNVISATYLEMNNFKLFCVINIIVCPNLSFGEVQLEDGSLVWSGNEIKQVEKVRGVPKWCHPSHFFWPLCLLSHANYHIFHKPFSTYCHYKIIFSNPFPLLLNTNYSIFLKPLAHIVINLWPQWVKSIIKVKNIMSNTKGAIYSNLHIHILNIIMS